MITSKFVWESFEKFKDEIFYINDNTTISYKQFYQKIKQAACQKELLYKKNEKTTFFIDSSLESLITFFAIIYNNAVPVLLSKQTPKEKVEKLLDSISGKVSFKTEDATIIFTSGSSSLPKAVLHTYSNYYYSALSSNENIRVQINDRWLLSLPLHHIGGLSIVFRTLLAGGTLVGYDRTVPLENTININKVTHVSVVSTQLRRILHSPQKLKSLKAVLVGGGMVPDDLITKAVELNIPIYKTYGMSEMSSQVTTTSQDAAQEELLTSGKILKYRKIHIADDNEILVKGEVLCKRYVNAEIPIDKDGWFHTGDIGSFDSSENLIVLGRKDRMFISGGENIYPEPIEKIIMGMDTIVKSCIVSKKSDEYGEVGVLFYKTEDGIEISITQLKKFLQDKIHLYEIPKELYKFPKEYKPLGIKPNYTFLKTWVNNQ